MIKATVIFILQMIYFLLISVPLACLLLITANVYFEAKRLIYKNKS